MQTAEIMIEENTSKSRQSYIKEKNIQLELKKIKK